MVGSAIYGRKAEGAMSLGAGAGREWAVRETFLRKKDESDPPSSSIAMERM